MRPTRSHSNLTKQNMIILLQEKAVFCLHQITDWPTPAGGLFCFFSGTSLRTALAVAKVKPTKVMLICFVAILPKTTSHWEWNRQGQPTANTCWWTTPQTNWHPFSFSQFQNGQETDLAADIKSPPEEQPKCFCPINHDGFQMAPSL